MRSLPLSGPGLKGRGSAAQDFDALHRFKRHLSRTYASRSSIPASRPFRLLLQTNGCADCGALSPCSAADQLKPENLTKPGPLLGIQRIPSLGPLRARSAVLSRS